MDDNIEDMEIPAPLSPCPFCGQSDPFGLEKLAVQYTSDDEAMVVVCERCEAQGPKADCIEDAVEGWNTRTETGRTMGWQHVAYSFDGEFHWMSGIAPRDCELFAKPLSSRSTS